MFRHVGIVVKNLEKMLSFYKDILGLEVISNEIESGTFINKILGRKGTSARIIKLGSNRSTIVELLDFENKESESFNSLFKIGITHFALTVVNVDELYKKMKAEGLNIISEPQISNNNKFKVMFCQDFEKNYIELVEIL